MVLISRCRQSLPKYEVRVIRTADEHGLLHQLAALEAEIQGPRRFGRGDCSSSVRLRTAYQLDHCYFRHDSHIPRCLGFLATRSYFGSNRVGSNLVPDDIEGLPSTHLKEHLASNKDVILYNAEIDHGKAFRCLRFEILLLITPCGIAWLLANSAVHLCSSCSCDEACCWLRKEYSTRTYLRIYSNRIEVNNPAVRFPYGYLGCGSWNGDKIIAHPFDRGAFGFQQVRIGSVDYICCCCPVYGGVMARHRCQCNGPLWNRTDGCAYC